ncbi:FadR/GntR family transcriptional regulator [Oscillospiraceae bacterium LTW-04]|nr:GntR family transcriptional regulator [Oscillospiraceae bacterium MB24-C1]
MEDNKSLMTPINNKSVVQKVIDKITDAIISGELKPGDKLPTEVEMVTAFQVGRNTVREAIRVLGAYGVVEIRRPEGTFVCNGFSEKLINPMLYSIILQKEDSYRDLIGLRRIIETGIMQLIRKQGLDENEWAELEHLCEDLSQKICSKTPDIEAIAEADIRFHYAMARATKNALVIKVHDVVVDLTRESRLRTIRRIFQEHDEEYLAKTHQDLLAALQGTDVAELYEAIENSYFYWKSSYNW